MKGPMRYLLILGALLFGMGTAQATTLPTLPTANVNTTMPTVTGSTLQATCATLQAQINAAAALNVNLTHEIILATGTTCTGPYKLASHTGGTGWILIKGSGYANLPAAGTRVSPTDAASMPMVKYGTDGVSHDGAFSAQAGAQRYRIIGMNMVQDSALEPNQHFVSMGYGNQAATNTGYIIIDRSLLRDTDAGHSTYRGVRDDAQLGNTAVIDSYISGIKGIGKESQAILAISNAGPILIQNNFLEAAGENVMFCGGQPSSQVTMPQDGTIRLNTFQVNPAWWARGGGFVVKALFELKCGLRVLFEGNTLENTAWDGEGKVIRLTPRAETAGFTYIEVSDITIRYNLIRNVTNAFLTMGSDDGGNGPLFHSMHSKRWYIHDNLIYGLGHLCGGGSSCGEFYSISAGSNQAGCTDPTPTCKMEDLTIAHNTVDNINGNGWVTYVDNAGHVNLDYKDNLINSNGSYGIYGISAGVTYNAVTLLNTVWAGPTWSFLNNSVAGIGGNGLASSTWPQGNGNTYPSNFSSFLWTNPASGDYTLQTGSPAKGTASDGTDKGVNFAAFNTARAGGTVVVTDTQAPAPVTGLAVPSPGGFSAVATWNATTDNIAVTTYNLKSCVGAACTPSGAVTSINALTYTIPNLVPSTTYGVAVSAGDAAGNQSAYSPTVYFNTPAGGATTATIVFDAASESGDNVSQATRSWSHTVGSANNRNLLVCTHARGAVSANTVPSSVTYGGVSLTKLRTDTVVTGTPDYMTTSIWELVAPPVGTANALITWPNFPGRYGVGAAVSLSGVNPTTPNDSITGNTGTGVTLSTTVTTIADNAWIVDCALGRADAGLTVGAGQTQREDRIVGAGSGVDGAGLSTRSKTPAGAQVVTWTQGSDNWAQSAVSLTPATIASVVAPVIASATADATGANLTYGATTPTTIRVTTDITSVVYPISSFPAGRLTFTWRPGMTHADFFARDVSGVESSSAVDSKRVDLTGIVAAVDTTPAVMTLSLPTAHLPFSATPVSTTIALALNKPVDDCRYDSTNIAYSAMDPILHTMRLVSLNANAVVTGVTVGTVTYYAQCTFVDAIGNSHPTITALAIPVTMDASTADVTPPGNISDLLAVALSATQVQVTSSVATGGDIAGYQDYLSYGTGSTDYQIASTPSVTTNNIVNVFPGLVANFVRKAVDTSNNLSVAFSNIQTLTLAPDVDVTPPSVMMNLRLYAGYRQSILLTADNGSDDRGGVTALIEQSPAGCASFSAIKSQALFPLRIDNLTPATAYCFRGKWADLVGNLSTSYSNVLQLTTPATGLNRDRQPLTQDRQPRVQ